MGKFNFIWLSCKKATFLISKREEGKLMPVERLQLRLHLWICVYCSRFQQQTRFITGRSQHLHEHNPPRLSEEMKAAIQVLLKD